MELIFLLLLYRLLKWIWPDDGSCGSSCGNDVFIPFEDNANHKEGFEDRKEYYQYEHDDYHEF